MNSDETCYFRNMKRMFKADLFNSMKAWADQLDPVKESGVSTQINLNSVIYIHIHISGMSKDSKTHE